MKKHKLKIQLKNKEIFHILILVLPKLDKTIDNLFWNCKITCLRCFIFLMPSYSFNHPFLKGSLNKFHGNFIATIATL